MEKTNDVRHVEKGMPVFDCNRVPLGMVAEVFGAVFKLAAYRPAASWHGLWVGLDHVAEVVPGQQVNLAITAAELKEFGIRIQESA